MTNSFEGGNFTPEQQNLEHQRGQYEKQAEKDAKKANTFLENIKGTGLNKEDIIYMDAESENNLRENLLTAESKSMRKEYLADELPKVQESALTKKEKTPLFVIHTHITNDKIEGLVGGKELILKYDKDGVYSGSFDGQRLSPSFAEEIYKKYDNVAGDRTEMISDLKKDIEIKKGKEKFKELA